MAPKARAHRPHLLSSVLAVAGVLLSVVTGCSATASQASPDTATTAGHILAALSAADEAAFDRVFATSADAARVGLWWDNLRQIELLSIVDGAGGSWQIGWRVPGEQGVTTNLIVPQWQCDAQQCLLGDIEQRPDSPAPIWLTEAISVEQDEAVTLIGGGDLDSWRQAAEQSAEFVRSTEAAGLIRPSSRQVIEVPGNSQAFEQVMAASAFDFIGTGAITWTADSGGPGPTGQPAPARIVINPDATSDAGTESRYLLLVHEQTHAATNWLGHPAAGQLWVSEGLAEWVMLQASPQAQQGSTQTLIDACPAASTPPADADFTDPDDLELAYAWSAAALDRLITGRDAASTISTLWQTPGAQPDLESPLVACG